MRRIYIEHELDLTRVRIRTRVRTNITSELEFKLNTLNFFDKNVSFTYETEQTGNISFLYVPIMRKNNGPIEFTIHQKLAHNDVYFHWESFVPDAQKIGTLKYLQLRAHNIWSNKELLDREIEHLKHVFVTLNVYPKQVALRITAKIEVEFSTISSSEMSSIPSSN